ncbi:MAG: hypothetical protein Q9169_004111 [Polycauliona sp. 2 TL-2023]
MISLSTAFSIGLLSLLQLHTIYGSPVPQAADGKSGLVEFSAAPAPKVAIGGSGDFVSIDSASKLFKIEGKTQYFTGTNTWWLPYTTTNKDVDKILGEIKASGLLVTRIWGFGNTNDASKADGTFFQELKDGKQKLNFDSDKGIPKLDYVVSKAEELGIKLIVPLLNGNDDLGGINTYVANYGGTKQSFFLDDESQKAYLAYVDFIVNRYKSSPAIFSWELCNEPRCKGCETSDITTWATTVSQQIKKWDPKHLVSLGDEGWFAPPQKAPDGANTYPYTGGEGVDFAANLAIPDIDFGTVHMYPDQWEESDDWGNDWIKEHDAIGKKLGKPVILEEYGVNRSKSDRVEIMQKWQDTIVKGGLAGDTFWQFEETLVGTEPGDEYGVVFSEDKGSEYGKLVVEHAKNMAGKAVGGS